MVLMLRAAEGTAETPQNWHRPGKKWRYPGLIVIGIKRTQNRQLLAQEVLGRFQLRN